MTSPIEQHGLRGPAGRRARMIIAVAIVVAAVLLLPMLVAPANDMRPHVEPGTIVEREYTWKYGSYSVSLQLSADDYLAATARDRGRVTVSSYADYITPDCPAVIALANAIAAIDGDPAKVALSFVQSIEYQTDIDGYGVDEYPAYPIETLVNGYGDCEDTAALYVSIMRALGYDAVLLAMFYLPGGHMAAGIAGPWESLFCIPYGGTTYYYCETTAPCGIGEKPSHILWEPSKVQVLGARS